MTKPGQSGMKRRLQESTAQHLEMVEETDKRLKLTTEDEIRKLNNQLIEKDIELALKAGELEAKAGELEVNAFSSLDVTEWLEGLWHFYFWAPPRVE